MLGTEPFDLSLEKRTGCDTDAATVLACHLFPPEKPSRRQALMRARALEAMALQYALRYLSKCIAHAAEVNVCTRTTRWPTRKPARTVWRRRQDTAAARAFAFR